METPHTYTTFTFTLVTHWGQFGLIWTDIQPLTPQLVDDPLTQVQTKGISGFISDSAAQSCGYTQILFIVSEQIREKAFTTHVWSLP